MIEPPQSSPPPAPPRLVRTLALVGLMGAGKTSVGKRLALILGVPFVDSDHEIAEAAGLLVMAVILLRFRLERPLLWGMLAITLNGLPMIMLGVDPVVVALVVAAFSEALRRSDIGVFDNFFELGGHSLMAARVMANVCESARVELPLRNLFERPTPEQLAAAIDALSWATVSSDQLAFAGGGEREEIEL